MSLKTVSVIGLGYIGLPTAAMFASHGHKVVGVDVDKRAVETINKGEIHIIEPELEGMVYTTVSKGQLHARTDPVPADAFLIAVPTPFKPEAEGGRPVPDLTYIRSAVEAIAPVLNKGNLVVLESTSPVGATEKMASWLSELRPDLGFPVSSVDTIDVNIAHCPERVLPGHVVRELVENDRIIGGMTEECSQRAVELYKTFVEGACIITNARTAEMAKLTENSFRDVNIAFANELSVICDRLNIDVWELIELANRHPRVNILQPGPGVGGHCIAVDPWFIVSSAPDESRLIHTARLVNDSKPEWVVDKVKVAIAEFLQDNPDKSTKDVSICCYGLAFKPDIDDLRESPAIRILRELVELHAGRMMAVEPNIEDLPDSFSGVQLCTCEEAQREADIHVVLVNHKEFYDLSLTGKVIDTKGIIQT